MLFALLCNLALSTRTSLAESSNVFITTPLQSPYLVQEGPGNLTLPCIMNQKYFDRGKYDLNWAQYNNGHLRIITKNSKVLVRKNSKFELTNNPTSGNYSLTITGIERNKVEGSYHCNIVALDDDDTQFSSIATVIVLVPPSDPKINIAPSGSMKEGELVTATCFTYGARPRPSFEWILPNKTAINISTITNFKDEYLTESIIHFQARPEDNNKFFQCKVRNAAMSDLETKDVTSNKLDVQFAPIVFISPTENSTHLTVEENSDVNLTCIESSNPPVYSYEWTYFSKTEKYHGKNIQFKANSSLSGKIECKTSNDLGERSACLELVVQYAPKVEVPKLLNPSESEEVNVLCNVDSNPSAVDVKWHGPNNFKQNGTKLLIKSVKRSHSGNYTCVVTNFLSLYGFSGSQQRTGSGTVFINVKRKPGAVQIDSIKNVDIGDTIHLTCKSSDDGNPPANYLWATPASGNIFGLEGHTMPNLTIQNAQLSDNGFYSCKTFNDIGEGGNATIKITVIERAIISNPLASELIFTVGEQNKSIECEAQGFPLPTITWLKNGKLLKPDEFLIKNTSSSKCETSDLCTHTVTSILKIKKSITWSDKGNFTCLADNGSYKIYDGKSSWTVLRVLHKPVIMKDYCFGKQLVAAEIGSFVHLKCIASGRPSPKFVWMFKNQTITKSNNYSIQNKIIAEKPDEYMETLRIENIQNSDYGDYTCGAINNNGADNITFTLKKTSQPTCPEQLKKESTSMDLLTLSWTPQFNGGLNQRFFIEMKTMDPFTGDFGNHGITRLVNNSCLQEKKEFENDGTMRTTMTYNLSSLAPLSTYSIRMRAENEKGESSFTPSIIATTDDVQGDLEIMPPKLLTFDRSNNEFVIEPKLPNDACILFYVLTNGVWRSTHCHKAVDLVNNKFNGKKLKARFCIILPVLKCSEFSNEVWGGTTRNWKYLFSILIVVFMIAGSVVLFFSKTCLRNSKNAEPLNFLPVVLSSTKEPPNNHCQKSPSSEKKCETGNFYEKSERSSSIMVEKNKNNLEEDGLVEENKSLGTNRATRHDRRCRKPGTCQDPTTWKINRTKLDSIGAVSSTQEQKKIESCQRIVREIIV